MDPSLGARHFGRATTPLEREASPREVSLRETPGQELPPVPSDFLRDGLPLLTDGLGRSYTYLRLSVTDRCDLACRYCMPPGGEEDLAERSEFLTAHEIGTVVSVLAQMGIRKVRLTGGEPLIRRDLSSIVRVIRERAEQIQEVHVSTNATRLASLAGELKAAGVFGVNISLDSLDRDRFCRITGRDALGRTLEGLDSALRAGLAVKLNIVLMAGENDDEAEALVRFAWSKGVTPRFIELMPLGVGGLLAERALVRNDALRSRFARTLGLTEEEPTGPLGGPIAGASAASPASEASAGDALLAGPARYLHVAGRPLCRVGFISSRTGEFCGACNRIRVTASGEIRACLGSRESVSLRDALRSGASASEVAWAFHWALSTKHARHMFDAEQASLRRFGPHSRVSMSLVGG